ncbi:MAG: DUF6883 domain-containing protein [Pirellulales bacterium]
MKLPGGQNAVVAMEKLTDYCLGTDHPRGKHKARVFAAACGITTENADLLVQALLEAAHQGEADPQLTDEYGQRFVIKWKVTGPTGTADVVTAWIVRYDEDFPRFVSAYVRQE